MTCNFPYCDLAKTGCPCPDLTTKNTTYIQDVSICGMKPPDVKKKIQSLEYEIHSLRSALEDIAEGRGMFGVSAENDLDWAMHRAAGALGLPWRDNHD